MPNFAPYAGATPTRHGAHGVTWVCLAFLEKILQVDATPHDILGMFWCLQIERRGLSHHSFLFFTYLHTLSTLGASNSRRFWGEYFARGISPAMPEPGLRGCEGRRDCGDEEERRRWAGDGGRQEERAGCCGHSAGLQFHSNTPFSVFFRSFLPVVIAAGICNHFYFRGTLLSHLPVSWRCCRRVFKRSTSSSVSARVPPSVPFLSLPWLGRSPWPPCIGRLWRYVIISCTRERVRAGGVVQCKNPLPPSWRNILRRRNAFHGVPQVYHYKQRHRHTCWSTFAAMNKDGGLFPQLGVVDSGTLLSGPSKANIETYCSHTFRRVRRLANSRCCCCYSVSWERKIQNCGEDA